MASPQKENGYTAIANEIIEQMVKTSFNATQLRIILVLWRYTYGFNRKEHQLSESFIVKASGISKRYVSSELNKLIDMKVIILVKPSTYTTPKTIAFNKNYEQWSTSGTILPLVNKSSSVEGELDTTVEQSFHTTVEQSFHTTVEQSFHQERNIKEIYKENIKKASCEIVSNCEQYLKTYNTMHIQEILSYLDDGMESELILEIIRDSAKKADKSPVNLCKSILSRCHSNNIKTLQKYIEDANQHKNKGGHGNGSDKHNIKSHSDDAEHNDGLLGYQRRWPETIRKTDNEVPEVSEPELDF